MLPRQFLPQAFHLKSKRTRKAFDPKFYDYFQVRIHNKTYIPSVYVLPEFQEEFKKKCRKQIKEHGTSTTESRSDAQLIRHILLKDEKPPYPGKVDIRHINTHVGWGVFAKRTIKEGERIGIYTGIWRHVDRCEFL